MSNRVKVMSLIFLFWVSLQIWLLSMGLSPGGILIFTILGSTISNLIGMYLDIYNDKVGKWFDSTDFFKM